MSISALRRHCFEDPGCLPRSDLLLLTTNSFKLQGIGRDRNHFGARRWDLVVLFGKRLSPNRSDSGISEIYCAPLELGISLAFGTTYRLWRVNEVKKKAGWLWPLGMVATGLGAAGVVIFRGCWHGKMSWPVRYQDHSYQVCLGCGIKRLFDEKAFRAYGPYSYDLNSLMARDRARISAAHSETEPAQHRTAS